MTTTHTPAPWEFHDDGETWQVVDADNHPICLVRHGKTDEERQRANARLMTAAPRMLLLLERWADQLPQGCMHVPNYLVEATADLLREMGT